MTTNLLLIAVFVFVMIIMSLNHNKRKKKVMFFGDNINEMDARPGGYISWIIDHLKNEGLDEKYTLVQSIKPGEKIYDLYLRLEDNVVVKDANIVVIYAGVNDVWDKYLKGTGTDIETFESLYHAVINKLKAANIKLVICTPVAWLKGDFSEVMQHEMHAYAQVIRNVALEHDLPLADLERAFEKAAPADEGGEQIESNPHRIIANEIWRILRDIK